jgi:hypothetical protein
MRLIRAIHRQRPLHTIKSRLLLSFPWEIGYFRFLWLTRMRTRQPRAYRSPDGSTAEIDYSKSYLDKYRPDHRIQWTMFLLASIPDCQRDSLLIIGPRYEPELLMARGLGWPPEGIRGLDTFSYAPGIDVGDMHALPYEDASFTSIICGWTLSYSSSPDVAATEMARVLRPGGYLVVAMQKVPDDYEEVLTGVLKGGDRIQTLGQLDSLFSRLNRVAGFEPVLSPGQHGHTIAAFRKPEVDGS